MQLNMRLDDCFFMFAWVIHSSAQVTPRKHPGTTSNTEKDNIITEEYNINPINSTDGQRWNGWYREEGGTMRSGGRWWGKMLILRNR